MGSVLIDDSDELYRRIITYHVKYDGSVSSAAFKDRRKKPERQISVDLAKLTTVDDCIRRGSESAAGSKFHVAVLVTQLPRKLGFRVVHDPEVDNYAHALITGDNDKRKCSELAAGCRLIK